MRKPGFSLIEIIVYLAVIGGSLLAVITIALNIRAFYAKAETQSELEYALGFACQRMTAAVRSASAIVTSSSQFNSGSGVLVVDAFGTEKVIDVESGRLRLTEQGSSYYLTPAKLSVQNFYLQPAGNSVVASTTLTWTAADSQEFFGQRSLSCSLAPAALCGANENGVCP